MGGWYGLAVLPWVAAVFWAAVWLPVLSRQKRALDRYEARFGERLDGWGQEMLAIRDGTARSDNRWRRAFTAYHLPVALAVAAVWPVRPGERHHPAAASVVVLVLSAALYSVAVAAAVRWAS
ncbi:MAG: hypothetical protein K2X97_06095 [Mycobacteriaceae bacterium]|nr:hypothetical protein [Mycobacteriaceae bacterium]